MLSKSFCIAFFSSALSSARPVQHPLQLAPIYNVYPAVHLNRAVPGSCTNLKIRVWIVSSNINQVITARTSTKRQQPGAGSVVVVLVAIAALSPSSPCIVIRHTPSSSHTHHTLIGFTHARDRQDHKITSSCKHMRSGAAMRVFSNLK